MPFCSTSLMTPSFWQGQPFPALSPARWQVSGWNLLSQAGAWVPELGEEPAERKDICLQGASGWCDAAGGQPPLLCWCPAPCCATAQPLQDAHMALAHSLHFCWGLCFAEGVLLTAAELPMLPGGCTHYTSVLMRTHIRFKREKEDLSLHWNL